MPNFLTSVMLFLSSYAPLFVIIAVRSWSTNRHLAVGLGILAVLSVVVLFAFLHTVRTLSVTKMKVASVRSRDGDVMSYIVTYLLPFLAVKPDDLTDVMSQGIFFLVIGILYVNSHMIYANPILNIVGYHIFEIEDVEGKVSSLICNRSYIRIGSEVDAISIGDYVLLEKR